MPPKFTAAFLKERNEREATYFRVYDTYTPNYYKTSVTSKFYSKYERPPNVVASPELMRNIEKTKYGTPHDKYNWPATVNQWYGWFTEPLLHLDRNDSRFYHPKHCTDFVKHGLRLKQDEEGFPKEKFTGVPFRIL